MLYLPDRRFTSSTQSLRIEASCPSVTSFVPATMWLMMATSTASLKRMRELQFIINDVLDDLKNGKEPELDGLGQMDLTQVVSFGKGELGAYLVRSPSEYYRLMLFWFLERNPQIAWCECCGRFLSQKRKRRLCTATESSRTARPVGLGTGLKIQAGGAEGQGTGGI